MLASEFDFDLPPELIAQHPAEPRDRSRLMVVDRRRGTWEHRVFADLPDLLDPRDILVRNDTRVIPARLVGRREATGGRWEGLFLRECSDGIWEILAKTRGRPRPGEHVVVGQGLRLMLEARGEAGRWFVRPEVDPGSSDPQATALTLLERHGQTPLPPYIRRGVEGPGDRLAYQTVYARQPGSAAAPTAGLHFTPEVLDRLAGRGIACVDLTLHVGLGTFRPIEVDRLDDHVMHAEWAELSPATVDRLVERRRQGGRMVAVGTTSARTLETAAASGILRPFAGETALFIRPGHVFRGLDALITNFHLPRSSLLVLISALAGVDLIRAAYADAVQNQYRFFSYGDAMLIL
ncbi:MAG: tRNA preQ1(34) S-adenosylmethionine ribosyltransferase-isomerase QueA [Isosphaeraceae bacterium]